MLRAERAKQAHLRALREEATQLGLNEAVRLELQASLVDVEPALKRLELLINTAVAKRRAATRRHGRAA